MARDLILLSILILSGVHTINTKFLSDFSQCGKRESTLKAVSMLFRYGDRAPAVPYPLDPYRDYPWPGGYEALSQRGAEQLHTSGLIKSVRYSSLLSTNCGSEIKIFIKF
ncbi:lysosomal acid phosphatase-like [Hermetia illucens]|uniref:lysosomal acid phosphatase-like n=1 Tax=Hermetia illucens TaxID=343691 RepID=UPI0018CC496F|nr:lysosomal acid phosphatase-like [Hermetia illucens]